ncbi:diaminohydroxyphosphoribosylaminopyrimidine reductase [Planctomyces bekefii]|uniref:Diaminohydroxyphosphoribosylaminopyrimidine reductase n=1 Tax=Planctomyces bekefii TaxID=1653850 RepID=A0A5C6M319_9PLAN|nr:diaminohydroxyphosphoribosylaminopyrimidine reductase [Planctomyces bekefii]
MEVINVMAVSLDGKIASYPGEPDAERRQLGFTNDDDHQHLIELVRSADAIVVGRSSIEASGGAFQEPNQEGRSPIWVVLSRSGPSESSVLWRQTGVERWLVTQEPLPSRSLDPKCRNIVAGKGSAARAALEALRSAGAQRVLLFGGAEINGLFYNENLVDRIILTICPIILGEGAPVPIIRGKLNSPVKMSLVYSQCKGNLVFLNYKIHKN